MTVSTDILRSHLEYSAWASRKLVEATAHLSLDARIHDFKTADRNILGTLVHIFAADRMWLGRVLHDPPPKFIDPEKDMHFHVLDRDWPVVSQKWVDWAKTLAADAPDAPLSYSDLKGNPFQTPLWQVVMHVVNHSTHHRGQVSGFLRALGHTPPRLDLTFYYREIG